VPLVCRRDRLPTAARPEQSAGSSSRRPLLAVSKPRTADAVDTTAPSSWADRPTTPQTGVVWLDASLGLTRRMLRHEIGVGQLVCRRRRIISMGKGTVRPVWFQRQSVGFTGGLTLGFSPRQDSLSLGVSRRRRILAHARVGRGLGPRLQPAPNPIDPLSLLPGNRDRHAPVAGRPGSPILPRFDSSFPFFPFPIFGTEFAHRSVSPLPVSTWA
jgi:hypothetical protein